jgi:hypothetical protein
MNEVTDTTRRGTWVIVRCFGNKARRACVWEENEHAVWVVDEETYRTGMNGAWIPGPYVGFRWMDVFEDDPDLFEQPDDFSWEALNPFSPLPRD